MFSKFQCEYVTGSADFFFLIFVNTDVLLRLSQITSTWVHELGWMEQLESEFVIGRSCFVLSWLFKTENDFNMMLYYKFYSFRYKWMTYGEASTARQAIGSGLRYYGLMKVSHSLENLNSLSLFKKKLLKELLQNFEIGFKLLILYILLWFYKYLKTNLSVASLAVYLRY